MIAHGRKQISEMVYARKASEGGGAVRLTNMIRGGAVVFGGLKPLSLYSPAATAYLKQNYGAYFMAISNYGKANQDMVPYVNAAPDAFGKIFSIPELKAMLDGGYMTIKEYDGALWLNILHHYVNSGANMFSNADDARYKLNVNLFSILKYIGEFKYNDKFEHLVDEYKYVNSVEPTKIIRWTQTSNAYTDTTVTGFVNIYNADGGLKYYNNNTLLSTGLTGWFGATGCWTLWGNGIPGFNISGDDRRTYGTLDVWIRIDWLPN